MPQYQASDCLYPSATLLLQPRVVGGCVTWMTRQTMTRVLSYTVSCTAGLLLQKNPGIEIADNLRRCVPGMLHSRVPGKARPNGDSH